MPQKTITVEEYNQLVEAVENLTSVTQDMAERSEEFGQVDWFERLARIKSDLNAFIIL